MRRHGFLTFLLPQGLTGLAALAGVLLFGYGVWAQLHRLALVARQGLGFADPFCTTGYCDYGMFWLAGLFTRHGQAALLYDHARYAALAAHLLPYKTGWWPFVYPPTVLAPAWAISFMGLVTGYYVVLGLVLAVSAWLLRRAGIARWCIAVGFVSQPAMWALYLGQLGLLCGALLVYGLASMAARPARAGVCLSLLAVKPQYALLVPVAGWAAKRWRVLAVGAGALLLWLAFSLWLGGLPAWAAYLGPGRAAARALLEQPFNAGGFQDMGSSVFWMLRSLGASLGVAYAGQGVMSLGCLFGVWRLWRGEDGGNRLAATMFLTLLTSPYGFTDDLAVYAVLLPTLARRGAHWRNAALAWLWVAPAFVTKCVALTGFLPTPLLLGAALGLSLAQQKQPLLAEQIRQPA